MPEECPYVVLACLVHTEVAAGKHEFHFVHEHMTTFPRNMIICSELPSINTVARWPLSKVISSFISLSLVSGTNTALEVAAKHTQTNRFTVQLNRTVRQTRGRHTAS